MRPDKKKVFRLFKKEDEGRIALIRWDDTGRKDMMILEVDDDRKEAKAYDIEDCYIQRVSHEQVCEVGDLVSFGKVG